MMPALPRMFRRRSRERACRNRRCTAGLQVRLHAAQERRQELRCASQIERQHLPGRTDAQLIALPKALKQLRAVGQRDLDQVCTNRKRACSQRRHLVYREGDVVRLSLRQAP
jgi:hypothetical protein